MCRIRPGLQIYMLVLVVALFLVSAVALATAPHADAYTHEWACYDGAYERCFDNSGRVFNPWHRMIATGQSKGGYCVKGEASNGGIYQFECVANATSVVGRDCSAPETHAYFYSNQGLQIESGYANTEGPC